MDDLETKIARALIAETRNLREPTPFDAVKAALSICDARYQPRADAKPAAPVCPKCGGGDVSVSYCVGRGFDHHNHWMAGEKEGVEHLERRCKGCRYWWSEPCIADEPRADVKPNAPASDDATEEAFGIVARATGRTALAVEHDAYLDPDGTDARLVREIAAALRRRSGVRIGKIDSVAEQVARAIGDDIGDRRGLKWEWQKIDEDVKAHIHAKWADIIKRALVALMARDGEGSR